MSSDSELEKAVLDSIDEKTAELRSKQKALQTRRIENDFDAMEERDRIAKVHDEINLDLNNPTYVNKIRNKNKAYFENLKHSMSFINNDFKEFVPYHPQSLILVAANTGDGKSTCSANLAYHALIQGKKVLMITNEETAEDAFNRVTCLIKGWAYTNHEDFSQVQLDTFDEYMVKLAHRMTIVDNSHADEPGQTTTIEGVKVIFDKLLGKLKQTDEKYDVIIIDYYQNVASSTKFPKLEPWQVQERFCRELDSFRKLYPAPIVAMAQKAGNAKDGENTSFKHLVEGRKMITNVATCAIEIIADRENQRTLWRIRKSRFSAGVGKEVTTGYQNGRYVPYTKEFRQKALRRKEEMEMNRVRGPKVKSEGSS